jgi:hypothetical protein
MAVIPFPASSIATDRLTQADQTELFARWTKGEVIEVETATSALFNCFLAAAEDGGEGFMFWREPNGEYVRQDTRTGRKMTGATLAEVMPPRPGALNRDQAPA